MTLKRLLSREGYEVITALSGEWALREIEDRDFDLVISDIKMPNMSGIETVKRIREYLRESNRKPIPEIFITAYAKEDIYEETLRLNVPAYIEKLFDVKTLLQTVKEIIEKTRIDTRYN